MFFLLLGLAALIVLLQLGLMAMLRKLTQQLDHERRRIAALEARLIEARVDAAARTVAEAPRAAPVAPPAVAPAPRPEPSAPTFRLADAAPPAAPRQAGAAPAAQGDAAELRSEMIGLMRQLVGQGLSVRDIAARCGLSEAEAELMLSLNGAANA